LKTAIVEKTRRSAAPAPMSAAFPRKALLHAPSFMKLRTRVQHFGIEVAHEAEFKRDDEAQDGYGSRNLQGVAFLMKKNKIDVVNVRENHRGGKVDVGGKTLEQSIVIATGFCCGAACQWAIDEKIIVSRPARSPRGSAKENIIIGAGVIGLELARCGGASALSRGRRIS